MKGVINSEFIHRLAGYVEAKIETFANANNLAPQLVAQRVAELLSPEGFGSEDRVSGVREDSTRLREVVGRAVEVGKRSPDRKTRGPYKRREKISGVEDKGKSFTMSAEARKRISDARRKWWASRTPEQRAKQVAASTSGVRKAKAKTAKLLRTK